MVIFSDTMVTTPSTVRVIESHTPGILKKLNSPSTSERKRLRVHFHDISSINNELLSSTIRSVSNVTANLEMEDSVPEEQSDIAVFPELKDSDEPITKIFLKLLPITAMGSSFLKGALKKQGVHTVGDLAKLSKKKVNSLPIRLPRVQTVINVLESFLANTRPAMAPPINEDLPLKEVPMLDDKGPQESYSSQSPVNEMPDTENVGETNETISDGSQLDVLNVIENISEKKGEQNEIPQNLTISSDYEKLKNSLLQFELSLELEKIDITTLESAEVLKLVSKAMQTLCVLQNNLLNKL
ncbi:unnamed protein product [Auanema sp. JU1783]|nr:unnamed protein product [Auanema sp. JU1783]